MKFCYVDESASRNGQVLVAAAIVVDAYRVHLIKAAWQVLITRMEARTGRTLREFKASDLYQGNGPWHGMDIVDRHAVVGEIVGLISDRRHQVLFSGVSSERFGNCAMRPAVDAPDLWCAAYLHILLAMQRAHQRLRGAKGQTAVIFDQGGHRDHILDFVSDPDGWTDGYYGRARRTPAMNTLIDVPFFVDSERVLLIQTADICAYVLRRHVELTDLAEAERFEGEATQVAGWTQSIAGRAPREHMWPARDADPAHDFFRQISAPSLIALRGPRPAR